MDDDRSLVSAVLEGDGRAFERLVRTHQRMVEHIVDRVLRDRDAVPDVCQEVFLAVHRHLPRFEFGARLSTWIGRIAFNAAYTHQRRADPALLESGFLGAGGDGEPDDVAFLDSLPSADAGPHERSDADEVEARVRAAVERLPAPWRVAVTLYHLDGLAIEEVAEVMGLPDNTVKSHLFRARKALKDHLLAHARAEDLLP
jgi:RNA polymerase sigma-70 factor (ECF subfamily)